MSLLGPLFRMTDTHLEIGGTEAVKGKGVQGLGLQGALIKNKFLPASFQHLSHYQAVQSFHHQLSLSLITPFVVWCLMVQKFRP